MLMTKTQAVAAFGNQSEIARALGISRAAVSLWSENLTQRQTDELVGAANRLGKTLPPGFSAESAAEQTA